MPRMHCMGTSIEIPEKGQICPRLPTNMVPVGTKCEVTCDSGSANVEYIKCDVDGWTSTDVHCSTSSTGLIVGLLVGGIIVVCIIAYVYARVKARKDNKNAGNNKKSQPVSRAAKIAARNDMMVTGVVTASSVQAGVVQPAPRKQQGKLVTGAPDHNEYRHPSSSSQVSNPPSYHSNYDATDERNYNATPTSKSGKNRRSRNSSNNEYPQAQRKQRPYYDEYTEEVDLGYHEDLPTPAVDGQYHSKQDNGPMYPDYYGQGHGIRHQYGAVDQNYYAQQMAVYPDQYLSNGVDNEAYSHGAGYKKPYRVPI